MRGPRITSTLPRNQTFAPSQVIGQVVLFALGCAFFASSPHAQEERIALVIGNANYRTARLLTPANDAQLMARTLENLGFEVTLRADQTQKQMKRLIRDFGERLERSKGIGLFYYSGHGVQVSGRNYMIPLGAEINRESDVDIEAVRVGGVLGVMDFARANINIVILDACRNNPYAKSFKSYSKGLARMHAPPGTLVAYATAPGEVAIAGDGTYSPYTQALAKEITAPGIPVEEVFKRTRRIVHKSTQGRQIPWEASSLIEDFYFSLDERQVPVMSPMRRDYSIDFFLGSWVGTGAEVLGATWIVEITIGKEKIQVSYPSLKCGGNLVLISDQDNRLTLRESINFGLKRCVDRGKVVLIPQDGDHVLFNYYYPNGELGATAVLTRL